MDSKKSTQIFVTGGTGFVGSYLLRYLLHAGYANLKALKRKESKMHLVADIANRVEWVEGDVTDYESLEQGMNGVEVVFHCAAIVSFDSRDKKWLKRVNADGTGNVVNAALHNKVKKLIHVSSVAALGRSANSNLIDETAKWEPGSLNSVYAISKFQAEMEVWRGMEEGLPAVVVNPSIILGSGEWKGSGSSKIFHLIGKGLPFYATGQNAFVDVRDVARFMMQFLDQELDGERYILASDNVNLKLLTSSIALAMGKRPPWIHISPWIGWLAWRGDRIRSFFTGVRPVITRETIENASHLWEYANDKSRAKGFTYIPLEQTIEETARQWLESKGEKPAILPLYLPG